MMLQFMLSQPPAEASAPEKCALVRQDAAAMISLALASLTVIWPLVGAILLKLPLQLILECATWPIAFFAIWRVVRQHRMLLVLAVNAFCFWLSLRFGFMGASSTAFFCFAFFVPAIIFEGRSHFKKIAISVAMPTSVLLGITLAYFCGRLPVPDVDISKRALKPSQLIGAFASTTYLSFYFSFAAIARMHVKAQLMI
jgi:hypothetical protein